MTIQKINWLAIAALSVACGDLGGDASGTAGAETTDTPPNTTGTNPNTSDTPPSPDGSGGGTTTAPGDTTAAPPDPGPPPIDFDLGIIPDAPEFCTPGDGEVEASYIWIANSTQSTISKIDTVSMIEEGRYLTRQDQNGSPSRTSVSLTGNVVVANRNGGITKFYANHDDCNDSNGNGVIDTANDATWQSWGNEECMAWHTPMVYASQRPVAWTQGEFDTAACSTINEKIWTSGANGNAIEVLLVDGDTGVVEDTIPIPGVSANFYGIYGAAVDSEGNFWGSQLGSGSLVRVNLQSLAVDTWPMAGSGYGMTVDQDGFVWTCSSTASRFDPVTETWQTAQVGGSGGCMADATGTLWLASNPVVGINTTTLAVEHQFNVPQGSHGVSIDFEGNVWAVSLFGTDAYRIDPDTGQFDTFTGLVSPYTYSDMTGFALSNVGGGGAPSG
ncbi:MAG: hypothetical protein K0V04_44545 [Deltaproteobacteria bacterium]|nr:hypothetical protein [Deltaproteobacteria bacterium]